MVALGACPCWEVFPFSEVVNDTLKDRSLVYCGEVVPLSEVANIYTTHTGYKTSGTVYLFYRGYPLLRVSVH